MRAGRFGSLVAALIVVSVLAAPAAAHENNLGASWLTEAVEPPGWYQPSATSRTSNFEMVGSVVRGKPLSTYRNSDLAFWGRLAYAGHYEGFQIIDVGNPRRPEVLSDFECPGSQHDVSVWQNLLFVSVETPRTSPACDSTTKPAADPAGFEGIRIFDVSNPRSPHLITGVPTDCGSHTHTLVPDPRNRRVLLYVASYTSPSSDLPPSSYGNECKRWEDEAGTKPAQNKISVVEVPLRSPAEASVVSEPRFPQNVYGGGRTGCHDITVFMELERAASACMGEGQIWDISDLENPRTIARVHNPNVEFFHSATWSYDGRRVIFGDEAGGGTQARCRPQDADTLGALWFYDVRDLDVMNGTTVSPWRSSWKVPRDQVKLTPEQPLEPNCTMHNFNTLPTKKGDVLVSSAYAAGTTMVDFSNIYRPKEVGHLDPEGANTWSAYWYNGHIYTNDGGRGVDVIKVRDRATRGSRNLQYSNPQTQIATLR